MVDTVVLYVGLGEKHLPHGEGVDHEHRKGPHEDDEQGQEQDDLDTRAVIPPPLLPRASGFHDAAGTDAGLRAAVLTCRNFEVAVRCRGLAVPGLCGGAAAARVLPR